MPKPNYSNYSTGKQNTLKLGAMRSLQLSIQKTLQMNCLDVMSVIHPEILH